MRELNTCESNQISAGMQAAPQGSRSAGEYFTTCMDYTNPNATWGAALTFASFIPVVGAYIAGATAAYTAGTAIVCGIGTIQYAQ